VAYLIRLGYATLFISTLNGGSMLPLPVVTYRANEL